MPRNASQTLPVVDLGAEAEHTRREESTRSSAALKKDLEDLRGRFNCEICLRPLYEPYTLECGHTFCYGCLIKWFENDVRKKTCPHCRTDVRRKPAPSYLIRDVVSMLTTRRELLPTGENAQEHKRCQEVETKALEADKKQGSVFKELFKNEERCHPRFIRDNADGVDRCARCAWELEDGECHNCGYPYSSDAYDNYTDTEDGHIHRWMTDESGEEDEEDDEDIEGMDTDESTDDDAYEMQSMDQFVVNTNLSHPSPRISQWTSDEDSEAHDESTLRGRLSDTSEIDSSDIYSTTVGDQSTRNPTRSPSRSEMTETSPTPLSRRGRPVRHIHILSSDDESMSASSEGTSFRMGRNNAQSQAPEDSDDSDESLAPVRRVVNRAPHRSRQQPNPHEEPAQATTSNVVLISDDSDESITAPTSRRARGLRPRNFSLDGEVDSMDPPQAEPGPPAEAQHHRNRRSQRDELIDAAVNAPSRPGQRMPGSGQRENVNMPGAFPPSFTFSDNGNSQALGGGSATVEGRHSNIPDIPTTSYSTHRGGTLTSEDNSTQSGPQSARREALQLRKAERRRKKAEQEARRRTQGGPIMHSAGGT